MKKQIKLAALKLLSLTAPLVKMFDSTLNKSILENRLVVFYSHFFDHADLSLLKENCKFIKRNCVMLPLPEALKRFSEGTLEPRSAAMVVDDATLSFYQNGFPILDKMGIPFSLAVIPGLIKEKEKYHLISRILRMAGHQYYLPLPKMMRLVCDFMGNGYEFTSFSDFFLVLRELPEDRLLGLIRVLKSLDHAFMPWKCVKELHDEYGVEILNHSTSHPQMRFVSGEWLDYELGFSKELLKQHAGVDVNQFVFPYGNLHQLTDEVREGLKRHGYVRSFVSHHGTFGADSDIYAIPRNDMECGMGLLQVNSYHVLNHFFYDGLYNFYLRHRRHNPVPQF